MPTSTRSPIESAATGLWPERGVLGLHRIPTSLRATILISIIVLSVMLWLYVARQMPLRYFVWFCFLTGAFMGLDLIIAKSFAERTKQDRFLAILLEVILGFIFVAAFYFFAAHIYPGIR